MLLAARSLIDQQRTANRNALTALLRGLDLGVDARKPLSNTQIEIIAGWCSAQAEPAVLTARAEAKRLALAVLEQTRQLLENLDQLKIHAEQLAPSLQGHPRASAP